MIKAFQGDINQNRLNIKEIAETLGKYGLINSFASLSANFFMLAQMFFFLNLTRLNEGFRKRRILRSVIMLLVSLSYVIYNSSIVGRDGVAFWIMSFIFQYLFFKKFINYKIRKQILNISIFLIIIISVPFILISTARFKDSSRGPYFEMLNYMGQQLINFNDQFNINPPLQLGSINFPVFTSFFRNIGFDIPMKMEQENFFYYFTTHQVLPNSFSTFVGSFNMDFGKIGTFLIIIPLCFVTYSVTKKSTYRNSFPISNYILFTLLFQNVYFGVFYFRLYALNFYIIAIILIFFVFKISQHRKKTIYIFHR
jgi:oligosaccharide repeat unit polymerase